MHSRLCYLSYDGHLANPIIQTQVVQVLASAPAARGGLLLAWEDRGGGPRREGEPTLLQRNGVQLSTLRRQPLAAGLLYERWRLPRILRGKHFQIAHARGIKAAFIAAALRRSKIVNSVVLDMRGDETSEALERWHDRHRLRHLVDWIALSRIAPRVAASANFVTCVSHELARMTQRLVPFKQLQVQVIPTASQFALSDADLQSRHTLRERWGLGDSVVLLYVGGQQEYQGLELLRPFLDGLREVQSQVRLLCAIHGPTSASGSLPEGPEVTLIRNADRDLVFELLVAADVGLLLRRPTAVNRVSAPVKFAEYRAMGLPVIATSASSFVSHTLSNGADGILVDSFGAESMRRVAEFLRLLDRSNYTRHERARRGASLHGIDVIARQYDDLWMRLSSAGSAR